MFSPFNHFSIKARRYSGWALIIASLLLHAFTVLCYSRLPDRFAAYTVVPMWMWGAVGLSLSGMAYVFLRAPLSMLLSIIWFITILLGSDEARVLANIGRGSPKPGAAEPYQGQQIIRVLTINCKSAPLDKILMDIKKWNADIILLQELHSYYVNQLNTDLYAGKGSYRVYKSGGILTRWNITKEYRYDQLRDQQVTIETPEGMRMQVVNLHLLSAATDVSLWRKECWQTHRINRYKRRAELGHVLQELEKISPPTKNPVIIAGDFNAPAQDSIYQMLQRDFEDAFAKSGTGWANTFPRRLPLMRLDHIYTTPHLQAVRSIAQTTEASDHRILIADFIWKKQ